MPTQIPIQAKVTKTAQFLGADVTLDDSVVGLAASDWTLVLVIHAQATTTVSRFVFEDSNNATTTYNTDIFPGPSASVAGAIATASGPKRYSWTKKDFPSLRWGATSVVGRLNLTEITGGSKSVTYEAWLEY